MEAAAVVVVESTHAAVAAVVVEVVGTGTDAAVDVLEKIWRGNEGRDCCKILQKLETEEEILMSLAPCLV